MRKKEPLHPSYGGDEDLAKAVAVFVKEMGISEENVMSRALRNKKLDSLIFQVRETITANNSHKDP